MVLRNLPITEDYEELKLYGKTTIERCFLCFTESSAGFLVSVVDSLECTTWKLFKSLEEFNMTVITTNVSLRLYKEPNTILIVNNLDLPEPSRLDHVEEPFKQLLLQV
jgi:GTP-binding protein LepA